MNTRLVCLATILCLATVRPAAGATIRVPQDFALIQAAGDAAQNGDTILLGTLRDSIWVEDVTLSGKSLIFLSAAGPQRTQIKRRILVTDLGPDDTTKFIGIRWNTGSSRDAISIEKGRFLVKGCVFDSSNECHLNVATISVGIQAQVQVEQCTFVAQPIAVTSYASSSVYVTSCLFVRSCALALGPRGGYLSADYCSFWNNADIADSSVDWGVGNIAFDPELREPDFALLPGSPCIDTGDPLLPDDPDGTRADIGAYIPYRSAGRLYVSTAGDDDSADGSLARPFRTIDLAYFFAVQQDSVLLLPGLYEEHFVFGRTSVRLASSGGAMNTTMSASEPDLPILDFRAGAGNRGTISELTVANAVNASGIFVRSGNHPRIEYCTLIANTPYEGGGVQINGDSTTVYGCLFRDNVATKKGGGVLSGGARHTVIDSCVFHDNHSGDGGPAIVFVGASNDAVITRNVIARNTYYDDYGGPVYLEFTHGVTLLNNTICENVSSNWNAPGAGITIYSCTGVDIRNNLVFSNQGNYGVAILASSSVIVCDYNDLYGNWFDTYMGVTPGPGSVSEYPLTAGYLENYRLLPGSPCIDAGDPSMPVPYGGGSVIDIGALEYQYPVDAGDAGASELPRAFTLNPNYPNPFNASTRISFALPAPAHAALTIFDALGRRVRTLVDGSLPAGRHDLTWDATDAQAQTVSSGVYFYRLDAGGKTETRKMVLLK